MIEPPGAKALLRSAGHVRLVYLQVVPGRPARQALHPARSQAQGDGGFTGTREGVEFARIRRI